MLRTLIGASIFTAIMVVSLDYARSNKNKINECEEEILSLLYPPEKSEPKYRSPATFLRVLDSENRISIGIVDGSQVLILGADYKKLSGFYDKGDDLYFTFNQGTTDMIISKRNDVYSICVVSEHENIFISSKISPHIIKHHKPIGMKGVSDQFDNIYDFFQR